MIYNNIVMQESSYRFWLGCTRTTLSMNDIKDIVNEGIDIYFPLEHFAWDTQTNAQRQTHGVFVRVRKTKGCFGVCSKLSNSRRDITHWTHQHIHCTAVRILGIYLLFLHKMCHGEKCFLCAQNKTLKIAMGSSSIYYTDWMAETRSVVKVT